MVVPYSKGLSENFKNIYSKHRMPEHFKGDNTVKNLLVASKDKDIITQKIGMTYTYKCYMVECDEEYIGKPAKTFGKGLKNTLK